MLAAGRMTVCLAFQTEVQILKDEEEDALGKESWESASCSIPGAFLEFLPSHIPPPWSVMLVLLVP